MKAYALLGGPKELWPQNLPFVLTEAKRQGQLIVGVDRGLLYLSELGVRADLGVGDFDSLKPAELADLELKISDMRYSNPVKDLTDSELMARIVLRDYAADQLLVFGATGGRLDHFLVNLWQLLSPAVLPYAPRVKLIDRQNEIEFFLPGKHQIKAKAHYSYFGVASLMAVDNLSITGARYQLHHFSAAYPRVFSSNEFLAGKPFCHLSFARGVVAVILAKDLKRFDNVTPKEN